MDKTTRCTGCNFTLRPGDPIVHLGGRPYCEICAARAYGPIVRTVEPRRGVGWLPATGYVSNDGYQRGNMRKVLGSR
jgi:hypothetical protein